MQTPRAIADAIQTVTADRRVTTQEWNQTLRPVLEALPPRATEGSRQVVALWASSGFEVEGEARHQLSEFLWTRGYELPSTRPAGISDWKLGRRIEQTNVSEVDRAFRALATAAGREGAEVNLAVIDNGFDLWHPALGPKGFVNEAEVASNGHDDDRDGKVDDSHGWDFVDWDNDLGHPRGDWHGTHVGGIATQGTDQVNLIPLRLLGGDHPYSAQGLGEAVTYAIEHGAKVINMSFGIDTPEKVALMKDLMARNPEVLFVAAAGNDGRSLDGYDPTQVLFANELPNLAVIAASDADGGRAGFSNHGEAATLAARGSDVYSTRPGATYGHISGTSMAAPQVANAAAKSLILDPGLSGEQVKDLLTVTSDSHEEWAGKVDAGGAINPARAYRLAALTGLVRAGQSPQAAADQLKLYPSERERLLPLVGRFVDAPLPSV